MLGESLVGWVALPVVLYALSLGWGLLIERAAGFRPAAALLAPLGFCALMCLTLAVYSLHGHGWLAVALSVAGALAGFAWTDRELRGRLAGGWPLAAGLAAYLLVLAPTALTGHWTWTGYNFTNDTAVHFLLAEWLQGHGTVHPAVAASTPGDWVRVYLETRYPLGTHSVLATLGEVLFTRVEVLYQAFLASMVALAAVALAMLPRRVLRRPAVAATAALVAVAANLTYQYALQGGIKEMGMLAALAVAAALGRDLIESPTPVRAVVGVAVALAGGVAAYASAAIPYVGVFALVLAIAMLVRRDNSLRRSILPAAAVGLAVLLVAAISTIVGIVKSAESVSGTFAATGAGGLGHLARQLPLSQVSGVYLQGEYIYPVDDPRAHTWTVILTVVVLIFAVSGIAWLLRARESGPLLFVLPAALTFAILSPFVSAYGDAKMLAVASAGVVLVAMCGALAIPRLPWPAGALGALVIAAGVLVSDAFAYHAVRIAPVARLDALRDAASHLPPTGQVNSLDTDEFAKYFARRPNLDLGFESITPRFAETVGGGPGFLTYYDADELKLPYVESFSGIVTRRGPAASRLPANFRPVYENAWYVVWKKTPGTRVVAHLPLQARDSRSLSPPDCAAVTRLARRARSRHGALLVSVRPQVALYDPTIEGPKQDYLWQLAQDAANPGVLRLVDPGEVHGTFDVTRAGHYRLWLRGSLGRTIQVWVDGRRVGNAQGRNTNMQYLRAGFVTLTPGRHSARLVRGKGSLAPGDGAPSFMGPLAVERIGESRVVRVDLTHPRTLCSRSLDWIEVVERTGTRP